MHKREREREIERERLHECTGECVCMWHAFDRPQGSLEDSAAKGGLLVDLAEEDIAAGAQKSKWETMDNEFKMGKANNKRRFSIEFFQVPFSSVNILSRYKFRPFPMKQICHRIILWLQIWRQ